MIGYDLDGVIAWEGALLDFFFERKPAWAVAMRDSRFNRCIGWPSHFGLIVTGRPIQDERSTRLWLYHKGIHLPVIHTEYVNDLASMVKADFVSHSTLAKIDVCKRNEIHVFVESDAAVREQMKAALPYVAVLSREEAMREGFLQPSKTGVSTPKSSRHENLASPSNRT